jgi:hypothetical protein
MTVLEFLILINVHEVIHFHAGNKRKKIIFESIGKKLFILVREVFHFVDFQYLLSMIVHKQLIVIEICKLIIDDEHVKMKLLIQEFVEYHRMKNLWKKNKNLIDILIFTKDKINKLRIDMWENQDLTEE